MSKLIRDWQSWVVKAEEDRLCIRNELAAAKTPWSVVCFHAQQAAEKYLKAFLVANGIDPERTHALDEVLKECLRFDGALAGLQADCRQLTDFAVDIRYPDIRVEDEEQIGRQAVAMAERICEAIRRKLPA
jgi:HEPN domain-containing protein